MPGSYHDEIETLSSSQLKIFCDSPTDYYETFRTRKMPKRKPTGDMALGMICHARLLEKKAFDDICRCYPTECLNVNGGLIGAKAKAFEEKIHPLIACKESMLESAEAICENAMKSPLGDVLRADFQFEQRVEAIVEGVPCRCKPDIHKALPDIGKVVCHDIKISTQLHPDKWFRIAKNLGYHLQGSHYSKILEEKYRLPVSFIFWVFETDYPYRVQPRYYDQRSVEISREYHSKKLAEFKKCEETGDWSDHWENVGVISPWDVGANDEGELVEFEG